jgi:hypothetical protein
MALALISPQPRARAVSSPETHATKLGTFHEDRHSQHRRLATVKGEIMIMNLMCVGVILIGLALVASHYVAEGYTEKSRREPDGSRGPSNDLSGIRN